MRICPAKCLPWPSLPSLRGSQDGTERAAARHAVAARPVTQRSLPAPCLPPAAPQFFKDKDKVGTLIGVKMKKDYRAVIDKFVAAPAAV